jgi:hypothetical protein
MDNPSKPPAAPLSYIRFPDAQKIDHPDGGYTISRADGVQLRLLPNRDIQGGLPRLTTVSIADVSQVESHHIASVHDTVSHTLHFRGGGVLSYMHAATGGVDEVTGPRIVLSTDEEGQVLTVVGTCPK